MKSEGEKIAVLTAYDASMASLLVRAGIDAILVGDSLGMVIQGQKDTLGVRLQEMEYHVRAVVTGAPEAFVIADLPFGFQASPEVAFQQSKRLLRAGATMVKLEGNQEIVPTIRFLVECGVPVCAHIGMLPQFVRASGGYRVQGRGGKAETDMIIESAVAIEAAGATCMVLELVQADLAKELSDRLSIPTIGIGSGVDCDGQVLVLHDMLGITTSERKFVRDFLSDAESVLEAIRAYITAVKDKQFPTSAESFH